MLLLNNQDVERLLPMKDCIEVIEEGYQELSTGLAANFPKGVGWISRRRHREKNLRDALSGGLGRSHTQKRDFCVVNKKRYQISGI